MRHIISVLVDNKPGVLARVAGLFSGRGFNIDSLCVSVTQEPGISRMTIVVHGDESILEQVKKQLNKLINVIKVQDFTGIDYVDRELVLVKVNLSKKSRSELMEISDIFRAKIVDVGKQNITVEITGREHKINAFIELIRPFGIVEVVRTGKVAIARR